MLTYRFDCERSEAPQHQVPGVVCARAYIGGEIEANDAEEAFAYVESLLPIPGTWDVRLVRKRRSGAVPLAPRVVTKASATE